MQKFFAVLFDAAYNIFLCVDKKDRRSHPKCRGPAGLFGVSTAVCAEHFSMFLYVICPFLSVKKLVILGQKGKAAGHFCTRTSTKFTGGERALQRESLEIVLYFYLSERL